MEGLSQELIAIIVAAIALAALMVPGMRALRHEVGELRREVAGLDRRLVADVRVIDVSYCIIWVLPTEANDARSSTPQGVYASLSRERFCQEVLSKASLDRFAKATNALRLSG